MIGGWLGAGGDGQIILAGNPPYDDYPPPDCKDPSYLEELWDNIKNYVQTYLTTPRDGIITTVIDTNTLQKQNQRLIAQGLDIDEIGVLCSDYKDRGWTDPQLWEKREGIAKVYDPQLEQWRWAYVHYYEYNRGGVQCAGRVRMKWKSWVGGGL